MHEDAAAAGAGRRHAVGHRRRAQRARAERDGARARAQGRRDQAGGGRSRSPSGPASSAFAGALKVTAAVVAVGAVVGAGVYVVSALLVEAGAGARARGARRRARRRRPRRAPPAEVDVPRRWSTPPRAPSKRRAPVAPAPAPVENASSLKEETALLGAANAALARGDVKRALSLLDDYDRRPGAGLLVQERDGDRHPRLLRRGPRRRGARGSTTVPRPLAALAARRARRRLVRRQRRPGAPDALSGPCRAGSRLLAALAAVAVAAGAGCDAGKTKLIGNDDPVARCLVPPAAPPAGTPRSTRSTSTRTASRCMSSAAVSDTALASACTDRRQHGALPRRRPRRR